MVFSLKESERIPIVILVGKVVDVLEYSVVLGSRENRKTRENAEGND